MSLRPLTFKEKLIVLGITIITLLIVLPLFACLLYVAQIFTKSFLSFLALCCIIGWVLLINKYWSHNG